MPTQVTGFLAPARVHYPCQIETQVEISLDIPAKSRTNARDGCLLPVFSGQRIIGSSGDIIGDQAAQVTLAGDQFAHQVGRIEFEVGDIAGISGNFALQKAAHGGYAGAMPNCSPNIRASGVYCAFKATRTCQLLSKAFTMLAPKRRIL